MYVCLYSQIEQPRSVTFLISTSSLLEYLNNDIIKYILKIYIFTIIIFFTFCLLFTCFSFSYSIVTGYQQNFYANLNAANFRVSQLLILELVKLAYY